MAKHKYSQADELFYMYNKLFPKEDYQYPVILFTRLLQHSSLLISRGSQLVYIIRLNEADRRSYVVFSRLSEHSLVFMTNTENLCLLVHDAIKDTNLSIVASSINPNEKKED